MYSAPKVIHQINKLVLDKLVLWSDWNNCMVKCRTCHLDLLFIQLRHYALQYLGNCQVHVAIK